MQRLTAICTVLFVCASCGSFGKDLPLVVDHEPRAVIVVARDAPEACKNAAGELQDYVKRATGAELPIITDDAPHGDAAVVSVGATQLATQAGLSVRSTDPEAFRIVRRGNAVYFLGKEEKGYGKFFSYSLGSGVEFATYEFLERVCGVRWLRPGPEGVLVPKQATVMVPDLDVEQAPSYQYRSSSYWYERKAARVHDTPYWHERVKRERGQLFEWLKHNKINMCWLVPGGHTHRNIVKKEEYAEHPEYFALVNGTRKPRGGKQGGWQLCTTNPEVARRAAEYARKMLGQSRLMVAVSPNDGGGHCECANCRALDVPGWTAKNRYGTEYTVLSDRYATFANTVARQLAPDFPDRFIGYSGYAAYRQPPRRVTLEPNIMMWLIQRQWFNWRPGEREEFHDFYKQWRMVQPDTFVLSGEFLSHEFRWGAPWSIIPLDAEVVKWAGQSYKVKSGFATIQNDWANNGIKYYTFMRLLWDATQDLDAVLDDYCTATYGAAAKPMRQYWDRLERGEKEWQGQLKEKPGLLQVAFDMPLIYNADVLRDCRQRLDQAVQQADTEWAKANVEFCRRGFDYTEMTTQAMSLYQQFQKAKDPADVERITGQLRPLWAKRRAFIEAQRDEGVVGYGQFNLMILDGSKFGNQQSFEQRFAFFETLRPETLLNPGFEEGLWGTWFRYNEGPGARLATENPRSGTRCMAIAEQGWVMQFLALVPGRKYRITGWMRTENVDRAGIRICNYVRPAFMRFSMLSRKTAHLRWAGRNTLTGTHGWQHASVEFVPEAPEVRIECYVGGNRGEAFYDDITLEQID